MSSATASASSAALTVTVCTSLQSDAVNSSVSPASVMSVPAGTDATTSTVSPAGGAVASFTVYVPLPPSATVSADSLTVTPGSSSSATVTAAVESAPTS